MTLACHHLHNGCLSASVAGGFIPRLRNDVTGIFSARLWSLLAASFLSADHLWPRIAARR